jgi:hypothetical protein
LFEHRVQTLLFAHRTSSTSKLQTYLYFKIWRRYTYTKYLPPNLQTKLSE